ncbi:membrane magnesium transporter 2-like [Apodemus sylvaticus]|uniref:membrane magnesium transporter 2-like n=1 Tax=Apodemus sylvaticus TaxID=10129 RepID=UPI002242950D|nr:membrane magnesium transporter 2-like [Apodemus sylvaticus]XP_052053436.1 membrane magnesium transporter 2-like [Apodemus sylvaticus]XP_052053437.1 membrane magnesium transporter 2-like [Apodemus sylvaticus]
MVARLWKVLVGIGLFALTHAAFSAAQHRSHMRLTEKKYEPLPPDLVLQTLLAFALTCYGVVHTAGDFRDRDATSELQNMTLDTLRNRPSFYVFHRSGCGMFQRSDTNHSSNLSMSASDARLKF